MASWDDLSEGQEQALDRLIQADVDPSKGDDKAEEKKSLAIGEHEQEAWRLRNKDFEAAMEFRRKYSKRIFILICSWLGFLAFVVMLCGLHGTIIIFSKSLIWGFNLSDMVLSALLGSSTITVVGLFGTVTGHFFNKGKK